MKIEITDGDELTKTIDALMCAIRYTNSRLKEGTESPHPERRSTIWWNNFERDVDVARTLSALLDKLEKREESNEEGDMK